jgi:arginyl-tRNA synthetase
MLDQAFRQAIVDVAGPEHRETDPLIRPAQRPEHGDFQSNCAMGLAKKLGASPRELAERIAAVVALGEIAEAPEIAGPGFINIRLRPEALGQFLEAMDTESLGVAPSDDPHPVAVDLCGVNVAKQMHVGHLRSTIIGDAISRVLERTGREVHRENHLGDWGLPIAMVLHQLRASGADLDTLELEDLDVAYRAAQLGGRADRRGLEAALRLHAGPHRIIELEEQYAGANEMVEAAKTTLVSLQQGDEVLRADWQKLIDCTLRALYDALDIMGVKLGRENNRGESFYREKLPGVIEAFTEAGIATEDQGALVVRFESRERPLLIRKSDGGFLYATTDLAAVRRRVHDLGCDRVIYVVDARQRDHFNDVFDAARLIGWDQTPDNATATLQHVPFGSVLGPDKKPLKTRAGRAVTLKSLLDEAVERGTVAVVENSEKPGNPTHGLSEAELQSIGRAVGIAAIKYADLSNDLSRDYVFDIDRMIAFEGDTGPYIQYMHARVCSIFRNADVEPADVATTPLVLTDPAEKQLALLLLRYAGVVADVADSLEPHRLCTYLYEVATAFSGFYHTCPVLKADDPATRSSRLRLSDLTRRVIADGLDLLGIDAPDRM